MAGTTPKRPQGKKLAQAAASTSSKAGRASRSGASSKKTTARRSTKAKGKTTRRSIKSQGKQARKRKVNYPRAGKGPIRRWIPSWKFFLGMLLAGVAAVVSIFAIAYATIDVPSANQFAQAQTSIVYYADGETEMGHFSEVNRTIIDTSEIPDYVGNAVVASEDRSFYTNNGVDVKGIVRAFWNNIRGGATQGASTLTQQYVKNYYVDTTDSYTGKFKQAIMALKIDQSHSKDEILGDYLNTVYFGRGAYGIEAASEAYYGKHASELNVSEAALLSAVLPAPSAYDPAVNQDLAKEKWQRVIDFMEEDGYITAADHDAAEFPETIAQKNEQTYGGSNGYLLQMVRNELVENAGLTKDEIDTGGYRIVTTINQKDQAAAVSAVAALPDDHASNLRVGLVSVDSSTGGIIALYGGKDYLENQYNSATEAVAQAGSTFKPFALIGALENGDTLSNGYYGTSPMDIGGTEFHNYGNYSYGWTNLIEATANSINTPYLQLNEDLGPEVTNEVAIRAGYPKDTVGMNSYVQNVLGSASPHTLDIATAFATFSADGVRHDTHIVSSVANSDKTIIYTASTKGEKVFDSSVMADATYAMQQVVNSGSGKLALALGRPIAAKTGSSTDNKSAQFAGFTPQIATAVTLFQPGADGSEESITPFGIYSEITGSTYPAQIFTDYMQVALSGLDVEYFPDRTAASYTPGVLYGDTSSTSTWAPTVSSEEETQAPTQAPTPVETQAPVVAPTAVSTPAPVSTPEPVATAAPSAVPAPTAAATAAPTSVSTP